MFKINDVVTWKWGSAEAEGKVSAVFTSKVAKEIKGTKVTRNASVAEPAYLIKQTDGDRVLKSHSELS